MINWILIGGAGKWQFFVFGFFKKKFVFFFPMKISFAFIWGKVWVFWEGHKIWKNIRHTFDKSVLFCVRNSILVKKSTKIFQNICGQVVLYKLYHQKPLNAGLCIQTGVNPWYQDCDFLKQGKSSRIKLGLSINQLEFWKKEGKLPTVQRSRAQLRWSTSLRSHQNLLREFGGIAFLLLWERNVTDYHNWLVSYLKKYS